MDGWWDSTLAAGLGQVLVLRWPAAPRLVLRAADVQGVEEQPVDHAERRDEDEVQGREDDPGHHVPELLEELHQWNRTLQS